MAQELDAGHLRHALVGEHDVDGLLAEDLQPVGGAGGAQDLVVEAEQVLDALDDVGLVVHDQDGVLGAHSAADLSRRPHNLCATGKHPAPIVVFLEDDRRRP